MKKLNSQGTVLSESYGAKGQAPLCPFFNEKFGGVKRMMYLCS